MILNIENIIAQGGFADIFAYNDRVYKLFISRTNSRCEEQDRGEKENELRRITFSSELKAWKIANANEKLNDLIPKFYGQIGIEKVLGANDTDSSTDYLLDCCLSMERIKATDVKFDTIRAIFPNIESMFHQAGISYTIDMSAFVINNGSKIKLIDFATEAAYFNTEMLWINSGKI